MLTLDALAQREEISLSEANQCGQRQWRDFVVIYVTLQHSESKLDISF